MNRKQKEDILFNCRMVCSNPLNESDWARGYMSGVKDTLSAIGYGLAYYNSGVDGKKVVIALWRNK